MTYIRATLDLPQQDRLLCDLTEKLTRNETGDYSDDIRILQQTGLEDCAILDALQVITYFNFVNRMVFGLGVTFTEEEMKGYFY